MTALFAAQAATRRPAPAGAWRSGVATDAARFVDAWPQGPVTLLVEDDPVFVDAIAGALAQVPAAGTLVACRSGSEVAAVLDGPRRSLALVLVDLGLPDVDGLDVIRAIRDMDPDVPLMVVSVMTSERRVIDAIRAGADGYLVKDEDGAPLATAIEQVLGGLSPISPAIARHLFAMARGTPGALPGVRFGLSPREAELLDHIGGGLTYLEAAERMGVSLSTVQTHVRHLYRKLHVNSRTEAVETARRHGLLPDDR